MSNIVYINKMDNLLKKYILLRLNQEEIENMYRPTENRYSTEIKPVSKKFPKKQKSRATWLHGRRQWHPTPVLLPGKSHGWRSLEGCSPWGHCGSDTTERLHFSLSRIAEGNGNPLQCSCLENPRDGGAWWAAVFGVTESQTRLNRLSSSSSRWLHRWIPSNV